MTEKYKVKQSARFSKDVKRAYKRGMNIRLLQDVISMLANGEQLPAKNKDHALTGNWSGYRECHIQPNWLLVYRIDKGELILVLSRLGSHSDLDLD